MYLFITTGLHRKDVRDPEDCGGVTVGGTGKGGQSHQTTGRYHRHCHDITAKRRPASSLFNLTRPLLGGGVKCIMGYVGLQEESCDVPEVCLEFRLWCF